MSTAVVDIRPRPAQPRDRERPRTDRGGLGLLSFGLIGSQIIAAVALIVVAIATSPLIHRALHGDSAAVDAVRADVTKAALTAPAVLTSLVVSWVVMLLVARQWAARQAPASPWARLGLARPTRQQLTVGLIGGAAMACIADGISIISTDAGWKVSSGAEDVFAGYHGVWAVLFFIAGTVGAPIVEEIYFRGAILPALTHRFTARAGVLGSAAIFGMMHFSGTNPGDVLNIVLVTACGAGLALARRHTGTLATGMVAHLTLNSVGLLLVAFT